MLKRIQTTIASLYAGIFLILVLSLSSLYLSSLSFFQDLHISSLTLAILLGMLYGNSIHHKTPSDWFAGITYSQKKLLRLGIILYGFRITFQQIFNVGLGALFFDVLVVAFISLLGYYLGTRLFKLNSRTSILVSAGSSICGAAAVLAVEATIKPRPHETAIAIATVVIFGTIAMFVFPSVVSLFGLNNQQMGIAIGGTVHEVAQVVAAGSMINPEVESVAVIVKLTRVMLLVPFLIVLGFIVARSKAFSGQASPQDAKGISFMSIFPWFALGFVVMSGINSLDLLGDGFIQWITGLDNLILTMAMAALGVESNFKKMKEVGFAPFILAGVLFFILMGFLYIPSWF